MIERRRIILILEHLSLARQIELVFKELIEELSHLSSGIIFIQIRNNIIGKFGVRHDPLESKDGQVNELKSGLSEMHQRTLRQVAVQSLAHKKRWTHGEILYEFAMKQSALQTSVMIESNYNMSNLFNRDH